MIVCDMCGKENPKCSVTIYDPSKFNSDRETKYDVCDHRKQKLKRFIEFERARNERNLRKGGLK